MNRTTLGGRDPGDSCPNGPPGGGDGRRGEGFFVWVRVKPRSRQDRVVGWGQDGYLEIQVRALPERGEANRSCRRQLAGLLGVPISRVLLDKGHSSVHKKFRVAGVSREQGERILAGVLGTGCVPS